ncbi:MAG: DUF3048 domain-containing protein [bacterium]|nr:DUF3048 domain-containing protein [bacterium]
MSLDRSSLNLFWTGCFCLFGVTLGSVSIRAWMIESGRDLPVSTQAEQPPEAYSAYTGLPITKKQAKQRAIGAMIAGDVITRPQSGLEAADIVVEMEAATGITRLLAIFSSELPDEIGSIRSARNDFIDVSAGFDAVLVHWGGEKRALDRLAATDTAEIDQFANGDLFYRKIDVPAPHNGFTTGELMRDGLLRYDYDRAHDFKAWEFKEGLEPDDRPAGGTLELTYGSADFDIEYTYDPVTNTYARAQGGTPHRDNTTQQVISPSNVLVVRANHFVYSPNGGYLEIDITNGGPCTLYNNGAEQDCRWKKGSNEQTPLTITDTAGKGLPFVAGKTWIQVMLPGAPVKWTAEPEPGTLDLQRQ